jgi:hypothetical protein
MDRGKSLLHESFWSIVAVTIILFAPSSGLITLTEPDEPYGNVAALPDASHLNKRASDDSEHFAFDTAFTTYDIHPKLFAFDDVMFAHLNDPYATLLSPDQIRAPPDRVIA